MQAYLARKLWLVGLTLFLGNSRAGVTFAQDPRPGEVLRSHGLKSSSRSTWILVGETPILKDIRVARELSAQLRSAQHQKQALELGNQNPKVWIDYYREQINLWDQRIAAIDQDLANLGPSVGNRAADNYHNMLVQERNTIVGEQRRLNSLINNLYDQRQQFQEQKQQFNGEVARFRESYLEGVSNLRKSIDEIKEKYAELANKEAITRALADLSASSKTRNKLGPSKEFETAITTLERLEGEVQSEKVELHRENGVDRIDAMLNGKGPVRMVFDTGAGPTTISASLASRLALKPTGRMVSCEVADGTKVMAKEMVIRSVGVGRLTVKNVTCVVMPKEKGEVAPLLGQSFLRHFDYKYTQGAGHLALTKIEPDELAAPPGKIKGTTKKPRGR
jgi:clan AA aspartic protease (TIGR02281 family)